MSEGKLARIDEAEIDFGNEIESTPKAVCLATFLRDRPPSQRDRWYPRSRFALYQPVRGWILAARPCFRKVDYTQLELMVMKALSLIRGLGIGVEAPNFDAGLRETLELTVLHWAACGPMPFEQRERMQREIDAARGK